jgi:glycosylphosphatidylinositol transamidase (GPIT) subunit GPI8
MNVMDLFLQNIDPIAFKKIDEIEKKKKISCQDFFKSQFRKEGSTEGDKGLCQREKREITKFFARNNGAHSTKKEMDHKKWNVKKAKV